MEIKLNIYKAGTSPSQNDLRCKVNKWTFSDRYMGEQYVTFDIESPTVIEWEVGDYCVFRGQSYTLNYIPSCTQNARIGESGKSFVYNNIKFNSFADELTRCIILDVVPTTGEYDQYAGTNYTGSAVFTLYCGETIWNNHVYAPVHALADRIWSNLIRLYPDAGWEIYVNDEACKSDDAIISFNNWTASQALAEVHNTFKCDYSIIGRKIYIGYSMPELTSTRTEPIGDESDEESDDSSMFFFGYGKGYPTISNGGGTALFEIKRTANSEQNIITRLRAYGSTKNLPYRYYSNKYGLPQTMYVNHLQLPDTFKPYDENSDPDGEYAGNYKVTGNAARDASEHDSDGNPLLRHVLGETNDAYIDKNDDAASCAEGIREGVGAWDGSDSNLEEIYPTIQGTTYADLRGNNVPDKSNQTGPNSYQTTAVYANEERVDEVLGVNEDCNIGDGTISLDSWSGREETLDAARELSSYTWVYGTSPQSSAFSGAGEVLLAETSSEQYPGDYVLSGTFDSVVMRTYFGYSGSPTSGSTSVITYNVGYRLRVVQHASDNGEDTELISYTTPMTTVTGSRTNAVMTDVLFVNLPDAINAAIEDESQQIKGIHVSETSKIRIYFKPIAQIVTTITSANAGNGLFFNYEIVSNKENVEPHLIWGPYSGEKFLEDETFHIYLKDLGFDLEEYQDKKVEDGEVQISMTSGNCVGRTFDLVSVEDYTDEATGKKGWKVELSRYKDDTLNIYYPNDHNIIASGDRFVILNIELPDSYIKAAELRLLRAATAYLADNCETKYTYEPSVNDIYLQQNIDRCEGSGHIENSIFWKLYAGLKFPFRGIPESNDELDPLPFLDITISQVEIRMGEKLTPQVSLQLNDDIEQSTIKKLTTAVDRLYNSVAVGGGGGMSLSAFNELLRTEGTKRFLSRIKDDTAAGTITFQKKSIHSQGAAFGNGGEIDENGDATLRDIEGRNVEFATETIADGQAEGDVVATYGETRDSLLDGQGTLITDDGRVQTTKMEVRGTLTVLDLIASQIHSLDGYYYFGDTMKIETVTRLLMSEEYDGDSGVYYPYYWKTYDDYLAYCEREGRTPESQVDLPVRYLLTFEKEYEKDFLKFYNEDVLLSIRTDLNGDESDESDDREPTEGGNTGLHDITAWSWMKVSQTSEQNKDLYVNKDIAVPVWKEVLDGGLRPDESSSLCALVTVYPSTGEGSIPSNTPPEAGYYITRRGNEITSPSSPDYKPERQNSWCISVEEGRLTYYINQTTPITGDENYGIAIGKLPDIKPIENLGKVGEIGIYTKNLLVENLYSIQWAGNVKYITIDKGEWNQADANSDEYYFSKTTNEDNTVVYTRVQVTHNGSVWQTTAIISGDDGEVAVHDAPTLGHTNWVHISGQMGDIFYYTTSETKDLDEGGVGMGSDVPYWRTDQAFFLNKYYDGSDSDDESDDENPWYYCEFRPYMWRKSVRYVGDDTTHTIEAEHPHIIGVFGETGRNYIVQTNVDYIPIEDESIERTLVIETFVENGGVRAEFDCYAKVIKVAVDGTETILNNDSPSYPAGHYWEIEDVEILPTDAYLDIYINSNGIDIKETYIAKKQIVIQKAVKGDKGDKGDDGYAGALTRVFQDELIYGFTYYSETSDVVVGTSVANYHYQDYIAVPCDGYQSGYIVFKCVDNNGYTFPTTAQHPAGDKFKISETYKTAIDIIGFMMNLNGGLSWEEVNVNAASAFFTNLIAQNAYIRMLTGSNFVITDNLGHVLAGMGNMTLHYDESDESDAEDEGKNYYIWAGGQNGSDAKFRVDADGSVKMNNGTFGGWTFHKPKLITSDNIQNYVTKTSKNLLDPSTGYIALTEVWELDLMKTGPCFVLYDEGGTGGLGEALDNDALYIYLPWFAKYVKCDITDSGTVHAYNEPVVGTNYETVRDAYALSGCNIHIFNASTARLWINGGIGVASESHNVPSDQSIYLEGSTSGPGKEFFATSTFSTIQQGNYSGTSLRWIQADITDYASTLIDRSHALYIAEME